MNLLPRTQDHLDIIDIRDDTVVLTGSRFRMVIEATAINFDLLSEEEQNATIFAYANLVNSLEYPVQVLIRTRQVDVTNYISYLNRHLREQPTTALRQQLEDYIHFVEQLVAENTVLQKHFYVVIPYWQATEAVKTATQSSGLLQSLPFFKKSSDTTALGYSKQAFEKAKTALGVRFEEVGWQFKRLGIQIKRLTTEDMIHLYYEIYNPEFGENRGLREDVTGYTASTVASNLSNYQQNG